MKWVCWFVSSDRRVVTEANPFTPSQVWKTLPALQSVAFQRCSRTAHLLYFLKRAVDFYFCFPHDHFDLQLLFFNIPTADKLSSCLCPSPPLICLKYIKYIHMQKIVAAVKMKSGDPYCAFYNSLQNVLFNSPPKIFIVAFHYQVKPDSSLPGCFFFFGVFFLISFYLSIISVVGTQDG